MSLDIESQIRRVLLPWQEVGNQIILLVPDRHKAHELNATASFLWQQLERKISINEIANKMVAEFEVDFKTAQQDIFQIMHTFLNEGLIEIC